MIIPWIFFLKEDEQLLVESFTQRRVVNGPRIYLAEPFQRIRRRKAATLGPTEYVLVRDNLTGELRNEFGPKLYFLRASDDLLERRKVITLKPNQYIRLIDDRSGKIRVEKGVETDGGEHRGDTERRVFLQPTEHILTEVTEGINIDEHTAVVVLDTLSGQRQLITEPQVFIPSPTQEVIGVSKRIRLEDHETVVVKDRQGRYIFHRGGEASGAGRSFFLDPYSELITFNWSTGLHKDKRTLSITRIDARPKFMWYEFEARTQDNVELLLGITFFWQIVDVEAMVKSTDDTPGDVCSHARSAIIQAVSQAPLETFLQSFNAIVRQAVLDDDDPFYSSRGVKLHAVEVRSAGCKDPETQRILQEIIREHTDRMNRLQKQESQNEVSLRQLGGEIEAEQQRSRLQTAQADNERSAEGLRGQLLAAQAQNELSMEEMRSRLLAAKAENERTAAQIAGDAEAVRVRSFLDKLGDDLPLEEKLAIFNTLRKGEVMESLSQGSAQLYFTPADVDLSIETRQRTNGR